MGRRHGQEIGSSDGESCKVAAKPWFEVHHLPAPAEKTGPCPLAVGGGFGGLGWGDDGPPDLDDGTQTGPGGPGPRPDPRLIPSMHLDVLSLAGPEERNVNALLHFAGDDAATGLGALIDGVPARSLQEAALSRRSSCPSAGWPASTGRWSIG